MDISKNLPLCILPNFGQVGRGTAGAHFLLRTKDDFYVDYILTVAHVPYKWLSPAAFRTDADKKVIDEFNRANLFSTYDRRGQHIDYVFEFYS